ncbi:bifunctional riboflavin kinase/FAD synthetase [Daejeonella lutea]|uniref:Riboflavin biosynthesis protein n=1 Tax=Daejeonella lutea TaxID=572036 RepID=A0A1T5EQB6_9SPHI|nr:bifunctional riboflavin kinase/FAD synthetase [Daejeonella lutea]SKB86141.1 riboflavin kinase / FMN adenylyltransferase [Daejeonella lutea]
MKIYNHIDEFSKISNAVVTIGTFDGVHIGHQKIISRLQEIARQKNGETVILTFFPHPRMILHPEDKAIKLITTMQEKAERLEALGIDHLIITPFTRDFSNLSPQEYIRKVLLDKIGTKHIVIGYDHRFGKDREGGLEHLQKFSSDFKFEVEEIPEQDINDVAVSSSKIRQAIFSGDVRTANDFLGYPFHLTGKVIKGDQIGRTLGFPTANLFVEEIYKLIPSDGIYAVNVEINRDSGDAQCLKGMAYIGHRPTINGMTHNIEVNIFDFSQDIYNQTIRINFLNFIRPDEKFVSLEALKVQLAKDEEAVRSILI